MSSQWNVLTRQDRRIDNVDEATVRDLLYRNQLSPEDWVAPVGSDDYRQIALVDCFSNVVSNSRRRRRKKQEPVAAMDMTPMIDVVFLLLIFFMITATFHLQTGMNFPPDKDDKKSTEQIQAPGMKDFDDRIVIEINEVDAFFVKTVGGTPAPVAVEDLVKAVREQGDSSNLNKVFVVAHEMSSLEAIVKAFDAAAEVGISDIALADVVTQKLSAPSGPIQIRRN